MTPNHLKDEWKLALLASAWIMVVIIRTSTTVEVKSWLGWTAGLLLGAGLLVGVGWHLRGIAEKRREVNHGSEEQQGR